MAPFRRVHIGGGVTDADTQVAVRLSVVAALEKTLVSNAEQEVRQDSPLADNDFAQGFTTGSHVWGYTLTSIGLRVGAGVSTLGTATLRADSLTGAVVAALTVPSSVRDSRSGAVNRA